jgi:uncharacterized protein YdhG (YjbR/CyaY superfamily)
VDAGTIDDYLTHVPRDQRAALERLRRAIHAIAPGVEECISYSLPAFRLKGRLVAGPIQASEGVRLRCAESEA